MNDRDLEDVDLLVIGGGKAGKSLAMDRAKAGWKVTMVERTRSVEPASTWPAFRPRRWSATREP
jgi:glycerol-3-phosphate dehydrogenase